MFLSSGHVITGSHVVFWAGLLCNDTHEVVSVLESADMIGCLCGTMCEPLLELTACSTTLHQQGRSSQFDLWGPYHRLCSLICLHDSAVTHKQDKQRAPETAASNTDTGTRLRQAHSPCDGGAFRFHLRICVCVCFNVLWRGKVILK